MQQTEMLFSNKDLKKLIIPLVVEQVLGVAVGMLDTVMISVCGEAAVSGVSLVDMVNQIILAVFAALGTGGAVVVSQYLGAENEENACRSARQLTVVAALLSACLGIVFLVAHHQILRLCFPGIEADVMQNAVTYLLMSALSFPFIGIYNACSAVFRAQGDAKTPMKLSLIMNIINFIGNAITIYVLGWGVFGAALASLAGRMFACVAGFALLYAPKLRIHLSGGSFLPEAAMIRRILYIGIPSAIEGSIFQVGRLFGVSILSGFGTVEIAANAVANNLDALGVMTGQALNLAVITVVGRCVGAEDFKQARYYTVKLLKISYATVIISCSLVLLFMPLLFRFYSLSPETLALARKLVLIHDGFAMLIWPISFLLPNVFRAANDVRFPLIISIGSMIVCRNCLSYYLAHKYGYGCLAVWTATIVDWVFRSICFVWRYRSGKWEQFYVRSKAEHGKGAAEAGN